MTQIFRKFDRCDCPVGNDKYGRMQSFHDAAEELDAELEALVVQ